MIFDKEEHRQFVKEMIAQVHVPAKVAPLVVEFMESIEKSVLKNDD